MLETENASQIKETAVRLAEQYRQEKWFVAVGVGVGTKGDAVYLYHKGKVPKPVVDECNNGADGFEIKVVESGEFKVC